MTDLLLVLIMLFVGGQFALNFQKVIADEKKKKKANKVTSEKDKQQQEKLKKELENFFKYNGDKQE